MGLFLDDLQVVGGDVGCQSGLLADLGQYRATEGQVADLLEGGDPGRGLVQVVAAGGGEGAPVLACLVPLDNLAAAPTVDAPVDVLLVARLRCDRPATDLADDVVDRLERAGKAGEEAVHPDRP